MKLKDIKPGMVIASKGENAIVLVNGKGDEGYGELLDFTLLKNPRSFRYQFQMHVGCSAVLGSWVFKNYHEITDPARIAELKKAAGVE